MTYAGWHLNSIQFTGKDKREAFLHFAKGLTLVYGASNTGKSFTLKTLDFMLGGGSLLPEIEERKPYDKIQLEIALSINRVVTLERAIAGGAFNLHEHGFAPKKLAEIHNAKNFSNLSNFLLNEMGATGKRIVVDASGTQKNLTFRDLASLVLTDETAIQAERSPVESGDKAEVPHERNVAKFMMTGDDDSAIIPFVRPKDYKSGRTAKLVMLQEMIEDLDDQIIANFPNVKELHSELDRIEEEIQLLETELLFVRSSASALLDTRRDLLFEISIAERRELEVGISLESFRQLETVYVSDIKRLEGLEEASFLLGRGGHRPCPVCGAPPEAQNHSHDLAVIEEMRVASEVEIQKVKLQYQELSKTIQGTNQEANGLIKSIVNLRDQLREVEQRITAATPNLEDQQRKFSNAIANRERIRRGIDLVNRRAELERQREDIEQSKIPKRPDKIQHGVSTQTGKALADVVSSVLTEWGFPGDRHVVFDNNTYDLIIDGKRRTDNGKGVRAITHAAFKVAQLLYCRKHELPHPGFLVLDTPLLTYRDPIRSRHGALSSDELKISNSDLKARFFKHLGSLGDNAQIIIFENIDPPHGIEDFALVTAFTNDPTSGRQGLL